MIRRGGIHWVDWSPGRGSEQSGRRPALVVQNDVGNRLGSTTIVAAITSRAMSKRYPFHVPLPPGTLPKPSTVMCEQLMTVSVTRLSEDPATTLDVAVMDEVDEALRRSLGL